MKVSIIIPIYNAEKYLENCLNSVINQTYKNLEIILIDDGSSDDSFDICKNIGKKDKRIKLYHKDNSGVSDTRNYGLTKASGEYIMFVDSDDYLDLDYVERIMICQNDNKADMIITGLTIDEKKESTKFGYKKKADMFINKDEGIHTYLNSYAFSSCCKTLYNKKIIDENKIKFTPDLKFGEDMLFSFTFFINSEKTYYLDCYGYHYRMNDDSATHDTSVNKRIKYLEDNFCLYKNIEKLLDEHKLKYSNRLFCDAILKTFDSGMTLLLRKKQCIDDSVLEIYNKFNPYLIKYNLFKSKLPLKIKFKILLLKYKKLNLYLKLAK